MRQDTERNIQECYEHIEQYLKNDTTTAELRKMCAHCKKYCGKEHDFIECKDMMCFKFWLAYEYLKWCNSFR